MAEADGENGSDAHWTVRLNDVERLLPDDDDDEGLWAVEFELNGPGVNGSLTAMLERSVNEDTIVSEGREMLRDALERWLKVLKRQPGGERGEPTGE